MSSVSEERINADKPSVSSAKSTRKRRGRKKTKLPQLRLNFKKQFKEILNGVHNDLRLTANTICVLNSFVNDLCDRLTEQAIHFRKVSNRKGLSHLDVAAACRLLLPRTLKSHAMMEATKALIYYKNTPTRK